MSQYLENVKSIKKEVPKLTSAGIIRYLQSRDTRIVYSDSSQDEQFLKAIKFDEKAKIYPAFSCEVGSKIYVVIRQKTPEHDLRILLLHEAGHILLGHNLSCTSADEEMEATRFAQACLRTELFQVATRSIFKGVAILCVVAALWQGAVFVKSSATHVYVTRTGQKYHESDCRYIKGRDGVREISLRQAKEGNYTACSVCFEE